MEWNPLYLLFFAFIVGAYIYYTKKNKQRTEYYQNLRAQYISKHLDLEPERKMELEAGHPWEGMNTKLLIELFGEPYRKRPMNSDASQMIWTYGSFFVYVDSGRVETWNQR